ncbi:hypothetical protein MD484_g3856, partial [Candolleomyces efflorescens]
MVFVVWFASSIGQDKVKKIADAIMEGCVDARLVLASMGGHSSCSEVIVRHYADLLCDWSGGSVGRDFWTEAEELVMDRYKRRARIREAPRVPRPSAPSMIP